MGRDVGGMRDRTRRQVLMMIVARKRRGRRRRRRRIVPTKLKVGMRMRTRTRTKRVSVSVACLTWKLNQKRAVANMMDMTAEIAAPSHRQPEEICQQRRRV
jgi:hypothetical protein